MSTTERNVLQSNLSLLKQFSPGLIERIQDCESVPCSNTTDQTLPDEHYLKEKQTFSDTIPDRYTFVFGIGAGEWLFNWLQNRSKPPQRLIVFEPSPQTFLNLIRSQDLHGFIDFSYVRLFVGDELERLEALLRDDLIQIGTWGLTIYTNKEARDQHTGIYDRSSQLLFYLERLAYENIRVQNARGFFIQANLLRNLPFMIRSQSLDVFENALIGVPAIVVGAGPSLNKNIDRLKNVPTGVLLVAVDTALRPLRQRGIQPDIIVTCDPMKINLRHFEGIPSLGDSILAYLPESHPEILERFGGAHLLCLHDFESKTLEYLADSFHTRSRFRRGMNVGYCAFSLARQMGCSPIILAGLDLAIGDGSRSHAEGTGNVSDVVLSDDGETARLKGNIESGDIPMIQVEGYDGGWVRTFPYFYTYLLLFERDITDMEIPVIDASEGGARKRGAVQKSLDAALEDCIPFPSFTNRIDELRKAKILSCSQTALEKLTKMRSKIEEAARELDAGLKRLEQWIKTMMEGAPEPDEIKRIVEMFQRRWDEMLYSQGLSRAIDLGLARFRYETRRADGPENVIVKEWAVWRLHQYSKWFKALRKDLVFFLQIYTYLQKSMNSS